VVQCPDGHYRKAIYGIGPWIADYPEQVWLSGIVQNWCPKYVALLNLSGTSAYPANRCYALPSEFNREGPLRSQGHRECLLELFDSTQLWDSFGINDEVIVSVIAPQHRFC
jgi:hypothetical protein